MKNLTTKILSFLENHGSPYINKKGVEIDLSIGEKVMACCNVPGFVSNDRYQLEYLLNYNSINSFIHKFSITSLDDLEKVNPAKIDILFQRGQVELWCYIYPSEEYLVYKRERNNILVINEEMTHFLGTPLKENEDFHKYTKYYFSA
jgi:hypothetical protein